MTTFGKTTAGGTFDNVAADFTQLSQYVLSQSLTVSTLKIYLDGNGAGVGSGPQPMKAVIYTDVSGNPDTLTATSNQVSISEAQAAGWVTFPLAAAVPLSAATYWLGFIADLPTNTARFTFDSVASQRRFLSDDYTDGPVATFSGGGTDAEQISVYAEDAATQVSVMVARHGVGMGRW